MKNEDRLKDMAD